MRKPAWLCMFEHAIVSLLFAGRMITHITLHDAMFASTLPLEPVHTKASCCYCNVFLTGVIYF